jgi:hypothetical protein
MKEMTPGDLSDTLLVSSSLQSAHVPLVVLTPQWTPPSSRVRAKGSAEGERG